MKGIWIISLLAAMSLVVAAAPQHDNASASGQEHRWSGKGKKVGLHKQKNEDRRILPHPWSGNKGKWHPNAPVATSGDEKHLHKLKKHEHAFDRREDEKDRRILPHATSGNRVRGHPIAPVATSQEARRRHRGDKDRDRDDRDKGKHKGKGDGG